MDEAKPERGIRVKRETIIALSDSTTTHDPDSSSQQIRDLAPTVTVRSGGDLVDGQVRQQYGQPKSFRKLSDASSLLSDIFRHPDTSEDLLRRKIKRANDRDTSRELIDFLRNTSPPPQNFMSFPYPGAGLAHDTGLGGDDTCGVSRKKRRSFWVPSLSWARGTKARARREKETENKKRVPHITLPDTAVAGRTTGGHLHIAISIPVEYAHLDGLKAVPETAESESVRKDIEKEEEKGEGTPPLIPPISHDTFDPFLAGGGGGSPGSLDAGSMISTGSMISSLGDSAPPSPMVGRFSTTTTTTPSSWNPRRSVALTRQGSVSRLVHVTTLDDNPSPVLDFVPKLPLRHSRRRLSDSTRIRRLSLTGSVSTEGSGPVVASKAPEQLFPGQDDYYYDYDQKYPTPHETNMAPEHDCRGPGIPPVPAYHHGDPDNTRVSPPADTPYPLLSDSHTLDAMLSDPARVAYPLCITPVMRMAESPSLPSSSSSSSLRVTSEPQERFVTASSSVHGMSRGYHPVDGICLGYDQDGGDELAFDLDISHGGPPTSKGILPATSPGKHTSRGAGTLSMEERILLKRRRSLPVFATEDTTTDLRVKRVPGSYCDQRSPSCQEEYEELSCEEGYGEPSPRREQEYEIDGLLNRLERLETNHERWVRALVPVLEGLTRGGFSRGGYRCGYTGVDYGHGDQRFENRQDRDTLSILDEESTLDSSTTARRQIGTPSGYHSLEDLQHQTDSGNWPPTHHGLVSTGHCHVDRGDLPDWCSHDSTPWEHDTTPLGNEDITPGGSETRWETDMIPGGNNEHILDNTSGMDTITTVMRYILGQQDGDYSD